jgi:alkylresorcinol/alkylpyrone synthase
LAEKDTRHSTEVLRTHGNMSSPSCLFALKTALANGTPDGPWWLASFGAGFSSYGALLDVTS